MKKLFLVGPDREDDAGMSALYFTEKELINSDIDANLEDAEKENLLLYEEFDNVPDDLATFLMSAPEVSQLIPNKIIRDERFKGFPLPIEPWDKY